MARKKLSTANWVAIGAIATVILAVVGVSQLFNRNSPVGLRALTPADPPALTADVRRFRYRHAETSFRHRDLLEEWENQWLEPLESKLKERGTSPEFLDTVVEAMKEIMLDNYRMEGVLSNYSVADSQKWYSVTIRNDGDVPLKGVFFKFPAADYWLDENDKLAFVPERIEIGDMDQKSELDFTFWGGGRGYRIPDEEAVLGHSDGIGTTEFN